LQNEHIDAIALTESTTRDVLAQGNQTSMAGAAVPRFCDFSASSDVDF